MFFLLLAANLMALVLFQSSGESGGEPVKGHEPYLAENIRLVSAAEIQARKALVPEEETVPPAEQNATAPRQCLEWGAVAAKDAERASTALQKLALWDKTATRQLERNSGFWVYMPPRRTLAEAQKKVEELKALGVQDSFIVQENTSWRYAVSLGVFSSSEAAEKYLGQLREKGVRSAITGPRNRIAEGTVYTLRDIEPAAVQEVEKLKPAFPGSEIKTVECR
jgi:hypothetical protein